jgi:hypothetical protein
MTSNALTSPAPYVQTLGASSPLKESADVYRAGCTHVGVGYFPNTYIGVRQERGDRRGMLFTCGMLLINNHLLGGHTLPPRNTAGTGSLKQ